MHLETRFYSWGVLNYHRILHAFFFQCTTCLYDKYTV